MPSGVILWEGESTFDGAPIVVILNSLRSRDRVNRKIGDMAQAYIILRDMSPWEAITRLDDASICGDCKMRPQFKTKGTNKKVKRACYVVVHPHTNGIFDAYTRGSYPYWNEVYEEIEDIVDGDKIRIGAYGDPAAVPFEVWEQILQKADGWTAFTHAWRYCDPRFKMIAMASVDSPEEYYAARDAGWRTYRSRLEHEPNLKGEISCPASKEGEKIKCSKCLLCNGKRTDIEDKRKNATIIVHGSGARTYREIVKPKLMVIQ